MSNATQTQQYREVSRKANAGERIKIVAAQLSGGFYRNGDIFTVSRVASGTDGSVHVARFTHRIWRSEYVVLEPIAPVAPTAASLPDLFAQFIRDNAPAVRSYLAELDPVDSAEPVTEVDEPAPPTLTRAEVIEMARERVAELSRIGGALHGRLAEGPFMTHYYNVEFHVNRDKRTVTALVRRRGNRNKPDAVGIAKAAPDDVFNADIGKAIAAERALGLALTDAFVNAPKPETAVAGMIVDSNTHLGDVTLVRSARGGIYNIDDSTLKVSTFRVLVGTRIIDDTDAVYTESAAKDGEAA